MAGGPVRTQLFGYFEIEPDESFDFIPAAGKVTVVETIQVCTSNSFATDLTHVAISYTPPSAPGSSGPLFEFYLGNVPEQTQQICCADLLVTTPITRVHVMDTWNGKWVLEESSTVSLVNIPLSGSPGVVQVVLCGYTLDLP